MTTDTSSKRTSVVLAKATGLTGTALLLMGAILLPTQPAQAFPAYAQKTGFTCGVCHVNPKGGGALNAYGTKWFTGGMKAPSVTVKKRVIHR
jgi:mono/diheme cytochrome c family protein